MYLSLLPYRDHLGEDFDTILDSADAANLRPVPLDAARVVTETT